MKSSIILTDRNAARVAEYAELVGWAPERLVNRLLTQKLDEFDNVGAGSLEGFLGSIDYDTRKSAEHALARVTEIARKQYGGRLPKSFKGKVRFNPDGTFGLTAQVGTGSDVYQIC
jgi:hypothetical protein